MKQLKLSVLMVLIMVVPGRCMTKSELDDFNNYLTRTSDLSLSLKGGLTEDEEDERASDNAWELSGKFEGDLILNDRQRRTIVENVAEGLSRNGLRDSTKKWPDNEVIYYIQREHFSSEQVDAIMEGIEDLQKSSCIKFKPYKKGDEDAVVIVGNRRGCFSQVGYQGGYQVLNLAARHPVGRGCFRHGTIVHEMLHALGFFHMQSSPDRDEYVKVVWQNIHEPAKHNFRKYNTFSVSDFGVGYDYDSVLHYSRGAFSANGKDTLIPKQAGVEIGQRNGLSDKDIEKLNKMYCDDDSSNADDEKESQKLPAKMKSKQKPFQGHGLGYNHGKTVVIKLPSSKTVDLKEMNRFGSGTGNLFPTFPPFKAITSDEKPQVFHKSVIEKPIFKDKNKTNSDERTILKESNKSEATTDNEEENDDTDDDDDDNSGGEVDDSKETIETKGKNGNDESKPPIDFDDHEESHGSDRTEFESNENNEAKKTSEENNKTESKENFDDASDEDYLEEAPEVDFGLNNEDDDEISAEKSSEDQNKKSPTYDYDSSLNHESKETTEHPLIHPWIKMNVDEEEYFENDSESNQNSEELSKENLESKIKATTTAKPPDKLKVLRDFLHKQDFDSLYNSHTLRTNSAQATTPSIFNWKLEEEMKLPLKWQGIGPPVELTKLQKLTRDDRGQHNFLDKLTNQNSYFKSVTPAAYEYVEHITTRAPKRMKSSDKLNVAIQQRINKMLDRF